MTKNARGLVLGAAAGPPVIVSPDAPADVRVAFTTRAGGVSAGPFATLNLSLSVGDDEDAVVENRRRAAAAAGFSIERLALMKQVHGCAVLSAGPGAAGVVGEGDGLITSEAGAVVGVLTADCAPVLLARPGTVGAAHAGWRGLVCGIVEATLDRMGGAERAWIGPSIRACCYEVGPDVIDAFRSRSLPVADERHVDPPAAAAELLRREGVERVDIAGACTYCDRSFFSYRRDGVTGRQGAFIWRM